MEDLIFDSIVEDILLELCISANYSVRSGNFQYDASLPQLSDLVDNYRKIESSKQATGKFSVCANYPLMVGSYISVVAVPTKQLQTVLCPVCLADVSGQRFAPHLGKCMKGGKRPIKVASTATLPVSVPSSSDNIVLTKPSASSNVDPYPESLVIRIKLKNGGKFCFSLFCFSLFFTCSFYLNLYVSKSLCIYIAIVFHRL